MATLAELARRCDEAMGRANAALDADWPARQSPAFVAATEQAITELTGLEQAMRALPRSELDRARTLRRLGGLHADFSAARGSSQLLEAERCYRAAARLFEGDAAPLGEAARAEAAKLDFNLANTLRQIDHNDVERLEEARRLGHRARVHFAAHDAQYLAQCDSMLRSVEALLRLAPLAREAEEGVRRAAALDQALKTPSAAPAVVQQAEELLRESKPAALLARLRAVIETLPADFRADPRFPAVLEQFAKANELATTRPAPPAADQAILEALHRRLEQDAAAGTMSAARKESLLDALGRVARTMSGADKSISELVNDTAAMRAFFDSWIENAHYLSHGLPRPPDGSRAAALVEMNWLLRRHLLQAMNREGKQEPESREVLDLTTRASAIDKRLYEAGADDARAATVEAEALRPLAIAVRQCSALAYVMPARPVWGGAAVAVNSSALFHAGPPGSEALLTIACRRSGLRLPAADAGEAYARTRWRQLQQAMAAVFDLRGDTPAERSGVCYELGIALTLGRPIVVLTGPAQALPFDIDVDPVELVADEGERGGGDENGRLVADAVDRAVCWTCPLPGGQPWRATAAHALASALAGSRAGDLYVAQTARLLQDESTLADPLATHHALAKLFEFLGDDHTRLLHPHWIPAYPATVVANGHGQPRARLFHVMPFRPAWSTPVAEATRAACRDAGAEYVRGDEVAQPDVIRSIWEEIARASHVLVDLTGSNANVALELGIAHTLGKPVLMVGQGATVDELFASVRKLRLQPYRGDAPAETLAKPLRDFLRRAS